MKYDYDVAVIGGGAAGLTASGLAVSLGAKTIMIESKKLGGDCTWYGCVPSKAILKSATLAHHIRHANQYGLTNTEPFVDFSRVMGRVHHIREDVYEDADRPEIYEKLGITVQHGYARFTDPHTLEIEGENTSRLTARYIIVATGSHPFIPPIKGLDRVDYLTNESIFELTEQPGRLAIIGGGPIGIEMAQAFSRLGTRVTVFERGQQFLQKDDTELANLLMGVLKKDGIEFMMQASVNRISNHESRVLIEAKIDGMEKSLNADAVLISTGRRPNIDGLNLDAAGVDYTRRGITVNKRGRSSVRHIYAIGDVKGGYQFTHMSEHTAKIAVMNALLKLPTKVDNKHIPWCTYTDPELAHLGATRAELEKQGKKFEIYRFPFKKIDRAITDSETTGWIKVYARKWNGKIYGVDILGTHAGDMLAEFALAMRNGVTLRKMADTIHPYPTYGLGSRRAADQWYVRQQSVGTVKWIKRIFRYRGPLPDLSDPDRIV